MKTAFQFTVMSNSCMIKSWKQVYSIIIVLTFIEYMYIISEALNLLYDLHVCASQHCLLTLCMVIREIMSSPIVRKSRCLIYFGSLKIPNKINTQLNSAWHAHFLLGNFNDSFSKQFQTRTNTGIIRLATRLIIKSIITLICQLLH